MSAESKEDNFVTIFGWCIGVLVVIILIVAGHKMYVFAQEKLEIIDYKKTYISVNHGRYTEKLFEPEEPEENERPDGQGFNYAFIMGGKTYTVSKEDYDMYEEGDFIRIKGVIGLSAVDIKVLGEFVPTKDRK